MVSVSTSARNQQNKRVSPNMRVICTLESSSGQRIKGSETNIKPTKKAKTYL